MKDKSKDSKIEKEMERLNDIFKDVDKDKTNALKGFIEEASYMKITLMELKKLIDENGPIDEMSQGEYSILREHPALKSYNAMIQRYISVTEKLFNLLPRELPVVEEDDGFDAFLSRR